MFDIRDKESIFTDLNEKGYSAIPSKNLDTWLKARAEFFALFDSRNKLQSLTDLEDGSFNQVLIKKMEGHSGSSQNYIQKLETIYIPNKSSEDSFKNLQDLAFSLLELQEWFFSFSEQDELHQDYFPAFRIHCYADDGFMGEHSDTHYIKPRQGHPYPMVQICCPLSLYGKEFASGGFHLKNGKEVIFPENNLNPGDVLLFNGALRHGVDPIGISDYVRAQLFVGHFGKLSSAKTINANGIAFNDLWIEA